MQRNVHLYITGSGWERKKLESIKSFEIGLGSEIVKNMVLNRLCKETYKNIDY